MASRSLGTLSVDLIAKIGGFTEGLNKAERSADKSAKEIEKSLKGISVASLAVGTALGNVLADGIRAAANAFPELIDQAGQFQDIAEKTGGSAAGFANFAVSAKVAGVEMDTIATASTRLSKALIGVDDESKAAGAGLASLGINIKDFKAALSADQQIKAVAEAFGQFAEGTEKAAVAQQIFGKTGAELLPFFKDYIENGGDVNILTDEMIQKADEFADAQTRLRAEISLFSSAVATNFIGPLNALISVAKEAIAEIYNVDGAATKVGINNGIKQFAEDAGRALASAIDYVRQSVKEFQVLVDFVSSSAKALKEVGSLNFSAAAQTGADFRARYGLDELGRKIGDAGAQAGKTYVQKFNDALASQARASFAATDPRRLDGGRAADSRPTLNVRPQGGAGGGGRRGGTSGAERISEAERYLQNLQKQLEKTQDLSTQEQVLLDIQTGRLGKVSEAQKSALLDVAGQIDAAKELQEIEKQRLAQEKEAEKVRQKMMDEGASIFELTRSPLENYISDVQRARELMAAGAIDADTYARQIDKLGKAFNDAENPAKDLNNELDEFGKNMAEGFQNTIADTLADGFKGGFKDIEKNFTDMLIKLAAQAVAADLTRKLFGATGGGQGEGWLGNIFSLFSSGARATGGPVMANSLYRVNENGPEVFQSANGEQYLMTGSKGGRVNPNGGGGTTIQQNVYVQGTPNARTVTQMAQETRRQTNAAQRRFS